MASYTLLNGVEMNKLHPATFEIPSADEIAAIQKGWFVKLGFKNKGDNTDGTVERMWVIVTSTNPKRYVGKLNNDPYITPINDGDAVSFKKENILSIIKPDFED